MSFFTYILDRFFYRFAEFFRHWYGNSFRLYSHFIISLLEKADRSFAFKITARHLFHPLYQDRTVIGYIFGFCFRLIRLVAGGLVHIFIIIIAILFYAIWLLIPLYIVFKILSPSSSLI